MQSTVIIVVCPRTLMPVISTVLQCCATADLASALRAAYFAISSQCLTGLYMLAVTSGLAGLQLGFHDKPVLPHGWCPLERGLSSW